MPSLGQSSALWKTTSISFDGNTDEESRRPSADILEGRSLSYLFFESFTHICHSGHRGQSSIVSEATSRFSSPKYSMKKKVHRIAILDLIVSRLEINTLAE